MYFLSEHFWQGEHHFQVSLIVGFAIRLAMRSGYHRDPSHFRHLTVFEGEMRRRVWAILAQLDVLFSSYLGLPRYINDRQTNTALPTSVSDEELYPEMTHLAPRYSSDAPSAIEFLNVREKITTLLTHITEYTSSCNEISYEKVLELDQALDENSSSRPIWFNSLLMSDEHVDNSADMNLAFAIDLLSQRARIILHRRFLSHAYQHPKEVISREKCVAAAVRMLHLQQAMSRIRFEINGMIVENWRALSFMSQNFLLGAMVVCFDIEQELRGDSARATNDLQQRLALLKSCQEILVDRENLPSSIQQAVDAIGVVISHADTAMDSARDGGEASVLPRSENWFLLTPTPLSGSPGISGASNSFGDPFGLFFDSVHEDYRFPQTTEILQSIIEDF